MEPGATVGSSDDGVDQARLAQSRPQRSFLLRVDPVEWKFFFRGRNAAWPGPSART